MESSPFANAPLLGKAATAQAAYLGRALPQQLIFKRALQLLNAFEKYLRLCLLGRLVLRHAHQLSGIEQLKLTHQPGRV
ncbi:MAG: hypothetical protein AWT59_2266 [Candidatus Gallionella acididurans]|uniref:Uncharacterized protein n=1 Tax=Candidatus Gallionella acididurans TaxID=1796491 RepID=A0A139BSA9_9PROT|nr:MAG: hypothetical protein AWT59_2266 [Candidatus Gallionella acididurans]